MHIFRLYLCYMISYVLTILSLGAYLFVKWSAIKKKVETARAG